VDIIKYYDLFIDDHSKFTWLYPLRAKSDVLSCFVKFKNLVENLFSCSIKYLLIDNWGEYVSTAFQHFTATHGILHKFTCPYTSEQNGISKRKHRHITETGLTTLAQSHLAPHYWVDAFSQPPISSTGYLPLFYNTFSTNILILVAQDLRVCLLSPS